MATATATAQATATATATSTATATATPTSTATPSPTLPGTPGALHSVAFDGRTAYGEAPDPSGALNPLTDWTLELWFRDDDPAGFDHDYRYLIDKGDGATPESPFYALLGNGSVLVGMRTAGANHPLTYNLHAAGYSPKIWQHLAASFQSSTTQLTLYLNGQQVAQQTLGVRASGNVLPLEFGRQSAGGSKYWRGKIDDVRIWTVLRSAAQIRAAYKTEITSPQPGLLASWHFDEGCGATAAEAAGTHPVTLSSATIWSADVPSAPSLTAPTTPVTATCP
jgi:hypothetical protein